MYIAKYAEAVYVLHVFTKKSHRGDETPKRDAEIIAARQSEASELHKQYVARQKEIQP
jgi:phage-related protein